MTILTSKPGLFTVFILLSISFVLLFLSTTILSAQSSSITIHVRGNTGEEDMNLTINNQQVGSWTDIDSTATLPYTAVVNNEMTINSIRVNSTSGQGWEHALIVDRIVIDGVDYQSEAPTTQGYTWDAYLGCTVGYKNLEWIACPNGWLEYEAAYGVVLANSGSGGCAPPANVPIIIYDTDMGPDIDDALALAMIHAYESNGEAKLAAVTVSRNSDIGARYCDLVNTFYNRPDIPIGKFFGYTTKDQSDYIFGASVQSGNYPHDVHTTGSIREGYKVMREALAASPDNSVVIIQTGFSTNTAELLQSPPDAISPLSGMQLVQQKVKFVSFMGGRNNTVYPEFNIEIHIPSAQYVVANCPVDIIQSEFGLGYYILYPLSSIYNDYNYVTNHPIKQAYLTTNLSWHEPNGASYDMRSWDLTGVIAGIDPLADYFKPGPRGNLVVHNDGTTTFTNSPNGKTRSLGISWDYTAAEQQKMIDRMIDLSSQPPGLGSSCISLQLKVCLEGPHQSAGNMSNQLQQLNLLPAGQPYNTSPWNYQGAEGAGWTPSDYPSNTVDWVLISLRSTPAPSTEMAKLAAILHQDGTITTNRSIPNDELLNAYYVVIEHRNHLPAMTPTPIDLISNTLTYDFTQVNSYVSGGGVGQKQVGNTWCLYSSNSDQSNPSGYEITGSDNILWAAKNGTFQQYLAVDYDMNGDVNANDKVYWYVNNGVFSAVPK